jgi:ABC-type Fe3+/spermidine/putrescine transport system ATPase subunit
MELVVEQLESKAGAFALGPLTLEVPSGTYGVILGAPGSGKSVLIETLCGLREPHAGRILMDGEDVSAMDPAKRGIGYVPQDYVLFPASTVEQNILLGLRARGQKPAEARRRMEESLDLLSIRHLADRWPATLSGGEQQRVALARAIATQPRLLLLDEPVSALDEGLREQVCCDLRRLQRELNITTLHVSHNQEEALAVSDWAAVLDAGHLRQVGQMGDLLRRPRDEAIARFFRVENIFRGEAAPLGEEGCVIDFAGNHLNAPARRSGPVSFMVRPERARLAGNLQGANVLTARVTGISDRGLYWRVELDAGTPIVVFHPIGQTIQIKTGDEVRIELPPEAIHVF